MSAVMGHTCETPDCGKKATLQCPTCLKMGIQGSFFCGQECFKSYWKSHKIIHLLASKWITNVSVAQIAQVLYNWMFSIRLIQKVPAQWVRKQTTNIVHGRTIRIRVNCDHFRKHRNAQCLNQLHGQTMPIIQPVVRSAKNRSVAIPPSKCWTMRKSKQWNCRANWDVKYWTKRQKRLPSASQRTNSIVSFTKHPLNVTATRVHWITTISRNHAALRWMKWFVTEYPTLGHYRFDWIRF